MLSMSEFLKNLEARITQLEGIGLSRNRILLDSGIDPAQYRSYVKSGRSFSDDMIHRLSENKDIGLPLTLMMAWKAIDEYGEDIILEAAERTLEKRRSER